MTEILCYSTLGFSVLHVIGEISCVNALSSLCGFLPRSQCVLSDTRFETFREKGGQDEATHASSGNYAPVPSSWDRRHHLAAILYTHAHARAHTGNITVRCHGNQPTILRCTHKAVLEVNTTVWFSNVGMGIIKIKKRSVSIGELAHGYMPVHFHVPIILNKN